MLLVDCLSSIKLARLCVSRVAIPYLCRHECGIASPCRLIFYDVAYFRVVLHCADLSYRSRRGQSRRQIQCSFCLMRSRRPNGFLIRQVVQLYDLSDEKWIPHRKIFKMRTCTDSTTCLRQIRVIRPCFTHWAMYSPFAMLWLVRLYKYAYVWLVTVYVTVLTFHWQSAVSYATESNKFAILDLFLYFAGELLTGWSFLHPKQDIESDLK